jgi:hypothetical protein
MCKRNLSILVILRMLVPSEGLHFAILCDIWRFVQIGSLSGVGYVPDSHHTKAVNRKDTSTSVGPIAGVP